jgi:hypothetical protein
VSSSAERTVFLLGQYFWHLRWLRKFVYGFNIKLYQNQITLFCDMIPCNMVHHYQYFDGTCCFHLQVQSTWHHIPEDTNFISISLGEIYAWKGKRSNTGAARACGSLPQWNERYQIGARNGSSNANWVARRLTTASGKRIKTRPLARQLQSQTVTTTLTARQQESSESTPAIAD